MSVLPDSCVCLAPLKVRKVRQKRVSGLLEMELETVVSHRVDSGTVPAGALSKHSTFS